MSFEDDRFPEQTRIIKKLTSWRKNGHATDGQCFQEHGKALEEARAKDRSVKNRDRDERIAQKHREIFQR